jgi:hypothetical protein
LLILADAIELPRLNYFRENINHKAWNARQLVRSSFTQNAVSFDRIYGESQPSAIWQINLLRISEHYMNIAHKFLQREVYCTNTEIYLNDCNKFSSGMVCRRVIHNILDIYNSLFESFIYE